ncbi:MAG TPA: arginine--tRNA ligase [Kiritimatiellia bacterium]|jgi:arginyl-tRNA synthetase|nr:MAG: Arginine--tRNA ligase [Verrucomicrobia bacterium ADurb.Bin018]HOD99792.1 arginine--tRNA ligase [Kiritimatiellia bacterium]HOE36797.1 arginine--tRNA ligase [Kiritimatiellia bacterium]HOR73391.1 arginine--tRNA ligase [Kiritimatiellia bacterium]HOU57940.1 arginine--tRNA ligase [Kiritimatiellia bacterium]
MQTIQDLLSEQVRAAFAAAFPGADLAGLPLAATPAGDEAFGDYQSNGAMAAAKVLRQPPRQVAEQVVRHLPTGDLLAKVEIAGPGFINMTLADDALARHVAAMQDDPHVGLPQSGAGRRLILDYSAPNVAKPMHIAHIRSTVIGDALKRIYRALGYEVLGDNHLGDWGTQFGILIMGYRHFLDKAALAASPVDELQRVYVLSHQRCEENPAWQDQARAELVKLQAGDPENRALWQTFIDLSLEEFNRIYARLGVSFELIRGESYYNDALPGVVQKLQDLGLVRESEGALVAFLDDEKLPPCIVRKSDGGYNYATTDLATVFSREQEFQPAAILYVTDERQQLHFRQFFAIARKAGVTTPLRHIWFGLMRLPEGLLSTRKGTAIKLDLLLDEAEKRALELVRQASPDMPEAQQQAVARAVGIGAVKYADLSQNPQSAVSFTWEKALAMDGNSAPYLQYAYARIASVLDKHAERFPGHDWCAAPLVLDSPHARRLALRLARYSGAVCAAAAQEKPSLLADALYDLSQAYSSFYQNVPFLKAEAGLRESRVRLCALTAKVLRHGLGLLGIETPDRI